jgi:hypothetical protein
MMSKKGIFDVGGEGFEERSINDVNIVDKMNVHRNSAHLGSTGKSRRAGAMNASRTRKRTYHCNFSPGQKLLDCLLLVFSVERVVGDGRSGGLLGACPRMEIRHRWRRGRGRGRRSRH